MRRGVVLVLAVSLIGLATPAGATKIGMVKAETISADYPELLEENPWDIWRLKISAAEPGQGVWRFENPYDDWKYVESIDFPPEVLDELGLPPDASNKDVAKAFKKIIQEIHFTVDIACVNVIDDRAVIAGKITKAGTVMESLLGTWTAVELFDTDAYDLDDYIASELELTEDVARGYCEDGATPDDGWDDRILVSGEIRISE